jgi:drug/metabolite transporter (DMT)-like permease
VPAEAWAGLVYITAISQFIGFFFYYKGLALGGIAKMSQLQLLLPFVAILSAHWILGEEVDGSVIVGSLVITGIVAAGRGGRIGGRGKVPVPVSVPVGMPID